MSHIEMIKLKFKVNTPPPHITSSNRWFPHAPRTSKNKNDPFKQTPLTILTFLFVYFLPIAAYAVVDLRTAKQFPHGPSRPLGKTPSHAMGNQLISRTPICADVDNPDFLPRDSTFFFCFYVFFHRSPITFLAMSRGYGRPVVGSCGNAKQESASFQRHPPRRLSKVRRTDTFVRITCTSVPTYIRYFFFVFFHDPSASRFGHGRVRAFRP